MLKQACRFWLARGRLAQLKGVACSTDQAACSTCCDPAGCKRLCSADCCRHPQLKHDGKEVGQACPPGAASSHGRPGQDEHRQQLRPHSHVDGPLVWGTAICPARHHSRLKSSGSYHAQQGSQGLVDNGSPFRRGLTGWGLRKHSSWHHGTTQQLQLPYQPCPIEDVDPTASN